MVTFFKKQQLIKIQHAKCSDDSDVRRLKGARCRKEYDASFSENELIKQVWHPLSKKADAVS